MPRLALIATFAALLAAAPLPSPAQAESPETLRVLPLWRPGERQTFVVQQVVKERTGDREETRFLANGTLEIEAIDATPTTLTFAWHRRMDNGELELAREPWGIRGNAAYEKLLTSTVKDGLPLTVKLDLRTHRVRIENRAELATVLARRLQGVGGESGNQPRRRPVTPEERNARDPSNAALGFHQPLVKRDATKYATTPRSGKVFAAWYVRLASSEIEDLLGFYGRELRRGDARDPAGAPVQAYVPSGPDQVLVTIARRATEATPADPVDDEDERDGAPGPISSPAAVGSDEAKIEVTLPSGWLKRAAIVHAEGTGSAASTTVRRVYLRQ